VIRSRPRFITIEIGKPIGQTRFQCSSYVQEIRDKGVCFTCFDEVIQRKEKADQCQHSECSDESEGVCFGIG